MIALSTTALEEAQASWRDLMANIVEGYHDSLRAALPRLEELADWVARERLLPILRLDCIRREFAILADWLRIHLDEQEEFLFPMIRHHFQSFDEAGWACPLSDAVEKQLDEATSDDLGVLTSARLMDHFLSETDWQGKGPLVVTLVKGLHELRADLEEHIQLETNVLFPALRELLQGNYQAMERLLEEGKRFRTAAPPDEIASVEKNAVHPIPAPSSLVEPSDAEEIVVADQETG
jgi:iron-sulfur cluster repair protein YtfE (RIC family)